MRRLPPSWALLAVAAALFTICGTIFANNAINNEAAWLMLGVAITLIGLWSAAEVFRSMQHPKDDDDESHPTSNR